MNSRVIWSGGEKKFVTAYVCIVKGTIGGEKNEGEMCKMWGGSR